MYSSMPDTIEFVITPFTDLTNVQVYGMLKLRSDVFVVEQACVYPDLDNKDLHTDSQHILCFKDEMLLGYARCLPPGVSFPNAASIGRVAVCASARGQGLASAIMQQAIATCRSHWPEKDIEIGAQTYLQDFYARIGFVPISPEYDEDGIMHVDMRLDKQP